MGGFDVLNRGIDVLGELEKLGSIVVNERNQASSTEKSGFFIFTTSTSACISGTWPLKLIFLNNFF